MDFEHIGLTIIEALCRWGISYNQCIKRTQTRLYVIAGTHSASESLTSRNTHTDEDLFVKMHHVSLEWRQSIEPQSIPCTACSQPRYLADVNKYECSMDQELNAYNHADSDVTRARLSRGQSADIRSSEWRADVIWNACWKEDAEIAELDIARPDNKKSNMLNDKRIKSCIARFNNDAVNMHVECSRYYMHNTPSSNVQRYNL